MDSQGFAFTIALLVIARIIALEVFANGYGCDRMSAAMTLEIVLGVLIVLIAGFALYAYSRRSVHVSHLVYMVLPPYEVPDMIVTGGVVVENRGTAPAQEVKISLAYPDGTAYKIRHLQVLSDVEYVQQGGGESESFVTLMVKQIDAHQKLIIYFSGPNRLLPRVTVTQGMIAEKRSAS